jgi:arsenate reductase (thioredoxin)
MNNKIIYLCTHGGAKSVIAAAYFNRLAHEHGLPYVAEAASAEDPYDAVPEPVVTYLRNDGIDVTTFVPRRVTEQDLDTAANVVGVGCAVPLPGGQRVRSEQWDDVPQASEDLEGSVAAIRSHVERLIEELRGTH